MIFTFVPDFTCLQGRGGSGTFQFLLDHDENHLMLRMDVDPSLLGLYDRTMGSWIPSSQGLVTRPGKPLVWPVTVHKKFTAFNTGNLPISVNEMWLLPAKVQHTLDCQE